jgi:hypothetical protein
LFAVARIPGTLQIKRYHGREMKIKSSNKKLLQYLWNFLRNLLVALLFFVSYVTILAGMVYSIRPVLDAIPESDNVASPLRWLLLAPVGVISMLAAIAIASSFRYAIFKDLSPHRRLSSEDTPYPLVHRDTIVAYRKNAPLSLDPLDYVKFLFDCSLRESQNMWNRISPLFLFQSFLTGLLATLIGNHYWTIIVIFIATVGIALAIFTYFIITVSAHYNQIWVYAIDQFTEHQIRNSKDDQFVWRQLANLTRHYDRSIPTPGAHSSTLAGAICIVMALAWSVALYVAIMIVFFPEYQPYFKLLLDVIRQRSLAP